MIDRRRFSSRRSRPLFYPVRRFICPGRDRGRRHVGQALARLPFVGLPTSLSIIARNFSRNVSSAASLWFRVTENCFQDMTITDDTTWSWYPRPCLRPDGSAQNAPVRGELYRNDREQNKKEIHHKNLQGEALCGKIGRFTVHWSEYRAHTPRDCCQHCG